MLLTDLNMPKMDGLGLIKGVRAGGINKFIPIIMLTTESQDSRKRRQGGRGHRLDRQAIQARTADRGGEKVLG